MVFTEVIYGDTYFLVNFSMDFLALFICSRVMKLRLKIIRTALGAATGALYALVTLMTGLEHTPIGRGLSLFIPCLMVYIAFGWGSIGHFLGKVFAFWVTSFVMGGAMTCIYYFAGEFLAKKQIYINGTVHTIYSGIPPWVFILCALGAAILTVIWNNISDRRFRVKQASLTVRVGERQIECEGLVDSGNLLLEPLSALPVIIISHKLCDRLIPGLSSFDAISGDIGADLGKVRIIPCKTVSGNGIMYGYMPDRVIINGIEKRAVICPSSGGKDALAGKSSPDAIIPASLL